MGCSFTITAEKGDSRTGVVKTSNGSFSTPAFMPVGTRASVKGLSSSQLVGTGAEIVLSNTYHLHLRPGESLIQSQGGIHRFMNWKGPILTDSGGYQAFSLSKLTKSSEEGVVFSSHIDGQKIALTPEKVIQIQRSLGVDIAMVLDVCSPYPSSDSQLQVDLEKTSRWAKRSIESRKETDEFSIFAIQQGGTNKELRVRSAEMLCEIDGFDGYAIGGVSVGEPPEKLHEITNYSARLLPKTKPRYLMGVGYPIDIVWGVKSGVDMFDCVIPTRSARFGRIFVGNTHINIKNARFSDDDLPLEPGCHCEACSGYSRAYINHLIKNDEMLGASLASIHNLSYYQRLVSALRDLNQVDMLLEQFESAECNESSIF